MSQIAAQSDRRLRDPTSVAIVDSNSEDRIKQAIRFLRESRSARCSYIAGQQTADLIPVTVVIRTDVGPMTGELTIHKDRWDPVQFLRFLQAQDCGPA